MQNDNNEIISLNKNSNKFIYEKLYKNFFKKRRK